MTRAAAFLLLALAACSRAPDAVPDAPSLKPECGVASFYHPTLADNLTANGETYDPEVFTAAHNELPFGTIVTVRRKDDGRESTVVINDRGPYVDGRIIDLSEAAADRLGLTGDDGVAEVCLEVWEDG